jgi:hypothetical protein
VSVADCRSDIFKFLGPCYATVARIAVARIAVAIIAVAITAVAITAVLLLLLLFQKLRLAIHKILWVFDSL